MDRTLAGNVTDIQWLLGFVRDGETLAERQRHVRVSGWWSSIIGAFVIAVALREIFKDLFQPSGSGSLSSFIGKWLFRVARKLTFLLPIAGPLALVIVIACWTFALAVGFALIYASVYPEQFTLSGQASRGFAEFVNLLAFSLSSLTTVGTPDLSPKLDWIRLTVAVESLVGFSLVTASISWIVLIYPALGRMRSLARRSAILVKAQRKTGIKAVSKDADSLLSELTKDVIQTRVDLIHYPLIYYFHADSERASLALALLIVEELARNAEKLEGAEHVRLEAAMLDAALSDLAKVLAHRFVKANEDDPHAVFDAFARDHMAGEETREHQQLR